MTITTCSRCGKDKLKAITMQNDEIVCKECYESIRKTIEQLNDDREQDAFNAGFNN